jgi:hypothetical protein
MDNEAGVATVSLREAAQRLREFEQYKKPGSKLARSELLNLLQTGRITASVIPPTEKQPILDLPSSFWATFSENRFKEIAIDSEKNREGVLYLTLSEIAPYYVKWLKAHIEEEWEDELLSALRLKSKIAATIRLHEWRRFLEEANLTPTADLPKKGRGRPPAENWKEALTAVAALLILAEGREPQAKGLATQAVELAKLKDTGPAPDTVAAQIAEIYAVADELRTRKAGIKPAK